MHRTALRPAASDALLTELTDSESAAAADWLAADVGCPKTGAARPEGGRRLMLRYVLTGATSAALAAMLTLAARGAGRTRPAETLVEETSVERLTGLSILQPGTTCANFKSIVYSSSHADDLDQCKARCAADNDCDGVLWRRNPDKACLPHHGETEMCALYKGKCEQADSACLERVDMAAADSYLVTGWSKGCTNWKSISLATTSHEKSASACSKRCSDYPGCQGFGYQHAEHQSDWGLGVGSCLLWKGFCQQGDNKAWNDHTMTVPTPNIYKTLGASMFCRNYKEIVLMHMPERLANEYACGVQCQITENCIGFAYKEQESCDSNEKVEGKASCILFQNECVPEPDKCWRTFRMTDAPATDLASVPQNMSVAALAVPASMHGKSLCVSELVDNEIVHPSYTAASTFTLKECANLCYTTAGCQGVRHTGDGTCLLLDEVCLEDFVGVAGQLRLKSASDSAKVIAGTASALAELDIPNATVEVSQASEGDAADRRLAPAGGTTHVWSVKWTFSAPGDTISEKSDAARKVFAAAKSWVANSAKFAGVVQQTLPGVDVESLAFAEPNATEPNATDLYELVWPTTPLTTSRRPGVGCSNWKSLALGVEKLDTTRGTCAARCGSTIGCVGFGYQFQTCGSLESMAKGACLLLAGSCAEETNSCWDKYNLADHTDFSKTSPPPAANLSAEQHEITHGSKQGTTITVTTTKLSSSDNVIFFNEVLYQSSNPDVPGVEIAGPDKMDLSGYRVVVYNHAGDVEKTVELSGTIEATHQQDYGVVWQGLSCHRFSAVALVHGDSNVINFLSVLDPVTASAAPATGLTSKVIKDAHGAALQAEDDTQMSMQLYGTGLSQTAFVWKVRTASPGEVNMLQNFG